MNRAMKIIAVIAIALCGTVGLTAVTASAKTKNSDPRSVLKHKSNDPRSVQKQVTPSAAKNCRRGAVAPFMRHPGHMNRGFLKKRC